MIKLTYDITGLAKELNNNTMKSINRVRTHILKFQGHYLLLFTQVRHKLQKYSDSNGPFFLTATIFYENSFVHERLIKEYFRNEQDNNSDDASYQMFFD